MLEARVISLPHRGDRKARFLQWNAKRDVSLVFFNAVDGRQLDSGKLVETGVLAQGETGFSAGALGCAMSHREIWTAAAKNRTPMLIMEDDCCLSGDFAAMAERLLLSVPDPWDILYLGYNTNAAITVALLPGLPTTLRFHDHVKKSPGWLGSYNQRHIPACTIHRVLQLWGTLCYIVTPEGAGNLLKHCFPLSSKRELHVIANQTSIAPYGIDGMINLAIRDGSIDAFAALPPLALGPNAQADSDTRARHGDQV